MKRTETILKCDNCPVQETIKGWVITEEARARGWIFAGNHHFCSVSCQSIHRKTRLNPPSYYPAVS